MAPPSDPAQALVAHADFVQRLAQGLLGDEGADVAQLTFLRILRAQPRQITAGLLVTTVRRLVRNALRGRRRRSLHELRAAQCAGDDGEPTPQQVMEREETRRRIVQAVLRLEPPFRQVVLLRFYEGMTPAQIAARLGIPAATVRTRIQRGLARLRHRLDDLHEGSRQAWGSVLLPFLHQAPLRGAWLPVLTMNKLLALLAAAVVLISCLIWIGPPAASPATLPRAGQGEVQAATTANAAPAADAAPAQRIPVQDVLPLQVVDEAGRGVAGAAVHLARASAPWIVDAEIRRLGATEVDGSMDLQLADLRDLGQKRQDLCVHHPDYQAASLDAAIVAEAVAAQQPLRVTLRHGCSQTFVFRLRSGEPVPGQTVVVGTTDEVESLAEAPPGAPGTTFEAVHRAVLEANGEATVHGLAPGHYIFAVDVDALRGVVEGPRASAGFDVPGPPLALTMDWLLAGAVVVRGDDILTWSCHYYPGQLGRSYAQSLDAMVALVRERDPELRDSKSPLTWVGFVNPRLQRPPAMQWGVLLARTGWHSGETVLRPLRDGFTTEVLTIPAEEPSAPMGTVIVEWPADLPELGFRLSRRMRSPTDREAMELPLRPRHPVQVPAGTYELLPDLATATHLAGVRSVVVKAGETTRCAMTLPEGIAVAEVDASFPSGRPVSEYTLEWSQYEREAGYQLRAARSKLILLPTGTVDLVLQARGCAKLPLRVQVAANDQVTRIEAVLQAPR